MKAFLATKVYMPIRFTLAVRLAFKIQNMRQIRNQHFCPPRMLLDPFKGVALPVNDCYIAIRWNGRVIGYFNREFSFTF